MFECEFTDNLEISKAFFDAFFSMTGEKDCSFPGGHGFDAVFGKRLVGVCHSIINTISRLSNPQEGGIPSGVPEILSKNITTVTNDHNSIVQIPFPTMTLEEYLSLITWMTIKPKVNSFMTSYATWVEPINPDKLIKFAQYFIELAEQLDKDLKYIPVRLVLFNADKGSQYEEMEDPVNNSVSVNLHAIAPEMNEVKFKGKLWHIFCFINQLLGYSLGFSKNKNIFNNLLQYDLVDYAILDLEQADRSCIFGIRNRDVETVKTNYFVYFSHSEKVKEYKDRFMKVLDQMNLRIAPREENKSIINDDLLNCIRVFGDHTSEAIKRGSELFSNSNAQYCVETDLDVTDNIRIVDVNVKGCKNNFLCNCGISVV